MNQSALMEGVRYLAEEDSLLAKAVSTCGPPPLWGMEQGFHTLIRIILEQQVSLASAKAAYDRLARTIHPVGPSSFLSLTDAALKQIGFSRQKTRYGRELANAIIDGELDLAGVDRLNDVDAKRELMTITGIGSWTADIYLLRALGRVDIWPLGDLALEVAIQRLKGWKRRPTKEKLLRVSSRWRPWRSAAARILWHYYLTASK